MDIGEAHRCWRPAEDQRQCGQPDRRDVGRSLLLLLFHYYAKTEAQQYTHEQEKINYNT